MRKHNYPNSSAIDHKNNLNIIVDKLYAMLKLLHILLTLFFTLFLCPSTSKKICLNIILLSVILYYYTICMWI